MVPCCRREDSMWCQWMKSYLFRGRSFGAVKVPQDSPWVWRKMLRLRLIHLLPSGFRLDPSILFNNSNLAISAKLEDLIREVLGVGLLPIPIRWSFLLVLLVIFSLLVEILGVCYVPLVCSLMTTSSLSAHFRLRCGQHSV